MPAQVQVGHHSHTLCAGAPRLAAPWWPGGPLHAAAARAAAAAVRNDPGVVLQVGWELVIANVGDSCAYLDTGSEIIQVSDAVTKSKMIQVSDAVNRSEIIQVSDAVNRGGGGRAEANQWLCSCLGCPLTAH